MRSRDSIKQAIGSLGIVWSIVFLSSCSPKPEDQIVGKWQEVDGTETIEIFKDGTVTFMDEGQSMGGNYEIIAEDRIKLELSGQGQLAGPFIAEATFSGDSLTFKMPDGTVLNYNKLK